VMVVMELVVLPGLYLQYNLGTYRVRWDRCCCFCMVANASAYAHTLLVAIKRKHSI
jgi:hypothetical protein